MKKGSRPKPQSCKTLVKPIESKKLLLPQGYEMPMDHGHEQSFETIRKATYRRKEIRVETTYKITIDNEPLRRHTMVMDDGTVHCHDFPNYSFPSAMDMARKIVDSMIEFEAPVDELNKRTAKKPRVGKRTARKHAGGK